MNNPGGSNNSAAPLNALTQRELDIVSMIAASEAAMFHRDSSTPRAYFKSLRDILKVKIGDYSEEEFDRAVAKLMGH